MLRASVHLEFPELRSADAVLGEHAPHCLLDDPLPENDVEPLIVDWDELDERRQMLLPIGA